jgi:hypothetical protein
MNKDSASMQQASTLSQQLPLNRKQRRAQKSKKQGRGVANGVAAVAAGAKRDLAEIELIVTGLAQSQEAMRQAFNQNHLAYSQAMGAVDGHIAVLRAVINDLQRGDLQLDEDGNINWVTYYEWYNQHLRAEQAAHAKEGGEQVAEEEIFGGDYEGGEAAEGDDDGGGIRQVPEGEQESTGEEAP